MAPRRPRLRCPRSAGSRLLVVGLVVLATGVASLVTPTAVPASAIAPVSTRHILIAGQLGSITYLTPASTQAVVVETDLDGGTFEGAVIAPDGETGYLTRGDNRIFVVDTITGSHIDDFAVPG